MYVCVCVCMCVYVCACMYVCMDGRMYVRACMYDVGRQGDRDGTRGWEVLDARTELCVTSKTPIDSGPRSGSDGAEID